MFKARPKSGAADPAATDKKYSTYHAPYKSYTYSQAWVDFLVDKLASDAMWEKLSTYTG
jgi:hypothetical protein